MSSSSKATEVAKALYAWETLNVGVSMEWDRETHIEWDEANDLVRGIWYVERHAHLDDVYCKELPKIMQQTFSEVSRRQDPEGGTLITYSSTVAHYSPYNYDKDYNKVAGHSIHLPKNYSTAWLVCHEVAHALSYKPCKKDEGGDGHGPAFVKTYIRLLAKYAGFNEEKLAESALHAGIL